MTLTASVLTPQVPTLGYSEIADGYSPELFVYHPNLKFWFLHPHFENKGVVPVPMYELQFRGSFESFG